MRVQGAGKNRMGGLFGRKRRGNWGERARVFISRSQSELKVMTKKVRECEGKEESRSCRRSM